MNANRTGMDTSYMTDWKTFLDENRGFIESFDFLKVSVAIQSSVSILKALVRTLINFQTLTLSLESFQSNLVNVLDNNSG